MALLWLSNHRGKAMFYFRKPLLNLFHKNRLTQKEIVEANDISHGFVTNVMSEDGVKSVDLYKLSILVSALDGNLSRVIKEAGK
jgi:hypothetical protein